MRAKGKYIATVTLDIDCEVTKKIGDRQAFKDMVFDGVDQALKELIEDEGGTSAIASVTVERQSAEMELIDDAEEV